MRMDRYQEEDKKEELKEKITSTLLIAALAITPAAVVYKVEQDKLQTMSEFYEALLIESNQASYYEGFFDGLSGMENNYYKYTDSKEELVETINLVTEIPKQEKHKRLVLTKTYNKE